MGHGQAGAGRVRDRHGISRQSESGIVIVTPALADANNGNWQTARRWARMLATEYPVRLVGQWPDEPSQASNTRPPALMIALHARRSAASIERWKAASPDSPLIVALTGTDLYRDIEIDASAQRSLELADGLIVLNTLGAQRLPERLRSKVTVVLQSCSARQPWPLAQRHLRVVMVGHLRAEKAPETLFAAARRLADRPDIVFDHIGGALDESLAQQARRLMQDCPNYRWLGALPHVEVRRRIQRAGLLVHPSRMEGGAHVVIEAIRSSTAVLASGIDGNIGLLGEGYEGYFPVGNAEALASLITSARDVPGMLVELRQQVSRRAERYAPEHEKATLLAQVRGLLTRH